MAQAPVRACRWGGVEVEDTVPVLQRFRLRRTTGEAGLTLTEMLVALFVLSAALLAVLGGFIASAASVESQQKRSQAIRVALDRHDFLRQQAYDSAALALTVGQPAYVATQAPGGARFEYATRVSLVSAGTGQSGDETKQVTTVVRWRKEGGGWDSVTYVTKVSREGATMGARPAYLQAFTSFTVAPTFATVDYDGYPAEDLVATLVATGYTYRDIMTLTYSDSRGARPPVQASSADGRRWTWTIPRTSFYLPLAPRQRQLVEFRVTSVNGLTGASTLEVFGPALNPPTIASFGVTPAPPIALFNGGPNRGKNQRDLTFTCVIDGMNTQTTSDVVEMVYPGENGVMATQPLVRTSVSGTTSTYTWQVPGGSQTTYNAGLRFFSTGQYTCRGRRATDGGRASTARSWTAQ